MSKISERLTNLGQTEKSGLGFGARAASAKIPVILVGVSIAEPGDAKGLEADLYVLAAGPKGVAQSTPIDNVDIWGVAVASGTAKEIDAAVEAGADFIVSEGESAPGAALRDDETGKGFVVNSDISEDRSKAIDSSPFDFLILDGSDISFPLNVGGVLDIQEQLARYSRHIFIQITKIPDQNDLELLRDIGVSALLYDVNSASKSDLKSLRKAIGQLEPKKQKSSADAVLPQHSGDTSARDDEDEFGDHDHEEELE